MVPLAETIHVSIDVIGIQTQLMFDGSETTMPLMCGTTMNAHTHVVSSEMSTIKLNHKFEAPQMGNAREGHDLLHENAKRAGKVVGTDHECFERVNNAFMHARFHTCSCTTVRML